MIENLKKIKKEIEFIHPEWEVELIKGDKVYGYEDCIEISFKEKDLEASVFYDEKYLISDNDNLGAYFIKIFEDEIDSFGQSVFFEKYYKKGCSFLKEFRLENNFKNKFEDVPYIGACIFEQDDSLVRQDIELMFKHELEVKEMFSKSKEENKYE